MIEDTDLKTEDCIFRYTEWAYYRLIHQLHCTF